VTPRRAITGRSIGFASCVGKAEADSVIKLPAHDAGRLRAIDPMRDDEQHWFNDVSEQFLYRYGRAGLTIFDELLDRCSGSAWPPTSPAECCPSPPTHPRI
jgi:hypothetical protein